MSELLGVSRHFIALLVIATVLKVILIMITPFGEDFANWVQGARQLFMLFGEGKLPSPDAYQGLMAVLVPFYWLWTVLPVAHPTLSEMVGHYSSPELALVLVMKTPELVFDLVIGVLLFQLVRERTGQGRKGEVAFLVWCLNPYNVYWIYHYGGFDVVPTALLLLGVIYGNGGKWIRFGLCASIAAILRLFPFVLFPFFLVYASMHGLRPAAKTLTGLLSPLGIVFLGLAYSMGSLGAVLPALARIPGHQPWLDDFWGYPLGVANVYFKLTPFLLAIQLFFVFRYWSESETLLEGITIASLLVMFVSQPQGNAHHFLWVSPYLSAYYSLGRVRWRLFASTFIAAALFPPFFDTPQRLLSLQIEPFFGGLFVGVKTIILLLVNMQAIGISPNLHSMTRYLSFFARPQEIRLDPASPQDPTSALKG